jgi:hypothetical protein
MKKYVLFLLATACFSCGSKQENLDGIVGLAPSNIYLNLENQGFETVKNLGGTTNGNIWENKKTIDNIDYQVTTYSKDIQVVETIKATALADNADDIQSTMQFFAMISSAPYESAKPAEASTWVKNNFDNDKASKVIGDAKFTLYAPSNFARMLTIEKTK